MSVARELRGYLERALESPALERLVRPSYPPFALEIAANRLVAVAVERTATGVGLQSRAVVELEPGVVMPSLLRPLVLDPGALKAAWRQALDALDGFDDRLTLVVPDQLAKVSFMELDKRSLTNAEMGEILRWKLKRSTPFRIEEAVIAHQALSGDGPGVRCVAMLMKIVVLEQLETIAAELGCEVGLVDLASFHLWNLLEGGVNLDQDTLLLNVADGVMTALIARHGEPLFVRCKAPAASGGDLAGQLLAELPPTLLYYQDRFGGTGLSRAVVRAPDELIPGLRQVLTEQNGVPVELVTAGLTGVRGLDDEEAMVLAPALGGAIGR